MFSRALRERLVDDTGGGFCGAASLIARSLRVCLPRSLFPHTDECLVPFVTSSLSYTMLQFSLSSCHFVNGGGATLYADRLGEIPQNFENPRDIHDRCRPPRGGAGKVRLVFVQPLTERVGRPRRAL
jgi:hypothetical protein